jgi:hypothetical protein
VATRCAKNIANTSVFEKSGVVGFYMEQFRRWQSRKNFAELSGKTVEVPGWLRKTMKCSRIAAAKTVAFHGMQYGVGDVVLVGRELWPYAVVRELPTIKNIYDTATMCHLNAASDYKALDITTKVAVHTKAWCEESKDELLILHH